MILKLQAGVSALHAAHPMATSTTMMVMPTALFARSLHHHLTKKDTHQCTTECLQYLHHRIHRLHVYHRGSSLPSLTATSASKRLVHMVSHRQKASTSTHTTT